jgi:hypothetical protein
MNSNQFSAFVDFAFNAGPGNFRKDFKQQILSGDWNGICSSIVTLGRHGTPKRHAVQAQLCSTPTDVMSGRPKKVSRSIGEADVDLRIKRDDVEALDSLQVEKRAVPGCPSCRAAPWPGADDENCVPSECASSHCRQRKDSGMHPNKCFG